MHTSLTFPTFSFELIIGRPQGVTFYLQCHSAVTVKQTAEKKLCKTTSKDKKKLQFKGSFQAVERGKCPVVGTE